VGYNPINGEAYTGKDNQEKPVDTTMKVSDTTNGNGQVPLSTAIENAQPPTNTHDNDTNGTNGQKVR
jgi:hypothetical protein